MKTRWMILISLTVNIALTLVIGWTLKSPGHPLPTPAIVREVQTTQSVTSVETVAPAASPPEAVPFHWSQLASEDLKLYRDRLREIGCPVRTVRRIILREIHERFEPRRRALLAGAQAQFWELALQGGDAIEKACEEPVESLKEEQEKLIEEVLGDEEPEPADARPGLTRGNRRYDWLSEDKREPMAVLDRKLNDARQKMYQEAHRSGPDTKPTPVAQAALKALETEVTAARKQLLTAAEYEDYELRNSSASHWAGNLAGFEATEDEWRSVARLVKQHDDAAKEVYERFGDKPLDPTARNEAIKKLDAELAKAKKESLGPERAAEAERGASGEYHQLCAVLRRYDLDNQLAARAYEVQQTAMTHANELRKNQNLDSEIRRDTLDAIRQETERTLVETLGQKAFATYQKYDRDWFKRLGDVGDAK